MKPQRTLHISFPEAEFDLLNEIMRESALTYTPVASVCRKRIRQGLKATPIQSTLVGAC